MARYLANGGVDHVPRRVPAQGHDPEPATLSVWRFLSGAWGLAIYSTSFFGRLFTHLASLISRKVGIPFACCASCRNSKNRLTEPERLMAGCNVGFDHGSHAAHIAPCR